MTTDNIRSAMNDFGSFLSIVNQALHGKKLARLESMLMPANFSSVVGEFMGAAIPKYAKGLVNNRHHNGHPDLVPAGKHPNDSVQHGAEGIEIKASRYLRGWQGHNAEDTWLMVFCFDSSRPTDAIKGVAPKPFRFLMVCGAALAQSDWTFAGRKGASRRTITASVNSSGYEKMTANWIYQWPRLSQEIDLVKTDHP